MAVPQGTQIQSYQRHFLCVNIDRTTERSLPVALYKLAHLLCFQTALRLHFSSCLSLRLVEDVTTEHELESRPASTSQFVIGFYHPVNHTGSPQDHQTLS